MGRTITVTLGDQEVEIQQLRTRPASEWRKSLQGPARDVIAQVSKLLNWSSVDLSDAKALDDLASAAMPLLTDSLDTVRDLVASYAPVLKAQIEDAYDDEIVAAFIQVVRLAFPFAQMMGAVRSLTSVGSSTPPTTASSPSVSGGAGTTS